MIWLKSNYDETLTPNMWGATPTYEVRIPLILTDGAASIPMHFLKEKHGWVYSGVDTLVSVDSIQLLFMEYCILRADRISPPYNVEGKFIVQHSQ